jgi:glycosyltransferase involved in cell wall biosynthesis
MAKRPPITVLVTTKNEVDQIEECLESALWADQIWLVDSFSTDGTVERVREKFPQVVVEQHEYFGAAAQKNRAIPKLANDWVVILDADERITPELRASIERELEDPKHWVYEVLRLNFMIGKPVRWGGLQRDWITRVLHRRHAVYQNRRVHGEVDFDGTKGRLTGWMLHHYIRSFDHMIQKMTNYGIWGAANDFRNGKRGSVWQVVVHPCWRFIRDYIVWRGFIDGTRGAILAGIHVYYVFWKYAKLWEYTELERQGKPIPLPPFDEDPTNWARPWESSGGGASDSADA